jgi:YHS domain-containing protein
MLRIALLVVLFIIFARAFWRLIDGVLDGIHGRPRTTGGPHRGGVQMVRDPVCGTFVLPDRALMLTDGRQPVFFCSTTCRDKYRARPEPAEGRTA